VFNSPRLLAVSTIILWSFGSLLSRLIAIQSEFTLLAISFFFTFLTILIYLVSSRNFSFSQFRNVRPGFWLIGPLGYFVYSVAYIQSSRTFDSISETTILNSTWPIFTVIFSDLFFHKIKRSRTTLWLDVLGIGLGFTAIIVLVTGGNFAAIQLDPKGIFWGLLAGVTYGLFGAYSGSIHNDEDQKIFLFISISISLLLILIPAAIELQQLKRLSLLDIAAAFGLGALLDGLGYIYWTRAIQLSKKNNTRISTIASLMFILPFINLYIVRLTLRESQLSQPFFIASLILLLISTAIIQRAEEIPSFFARVIKHLLGS